MSVELKRKGFGEWLLWHLFGLVPYWIRTKDKEIIFYASVKNCQDFDRFIISQTQVADYQSNKPIDVFKGE